MPSAFFAALALDASAAADEVTAEAWLLQPMVAVDHTAAPVADSTRPAVIFVATYADPEAKANVPNSYDKRQARRPGVESGTPRLIVSPAAIAAATASVGSDFEAVQGDCLVRQADGVTWRVATAFAMAGGSLKLGISLIG